MCMRGLHSYKYSSTNTMRFGVTTVGKSSQVKSEWSSFWRRLIFMQFVSVLESQDAGTDRTCAMSVCSGLLDTAGVLCL